MEIKRFVASFPWILPSKSGAIFPAKKKMQLLYRSIRGYVLYYAIDSDEKWIGYCFLKKNYLNRYTFMKQGDYIISGYYTFPQYRNQGIANKIIARALKEPANSIWAIVRDNNLPSLSVLKNNGFAEVGFSKEERMKFFLGKEKSKDIVLKNDVNENTRYHA